MRQIIAACRRGNIDFAASFALDEDAGDEDVWLPPRLGPGFHRVPPQSIAAHTLRVRNAPKKTEILRLLTKYGEWGSCVRGRRRRPGAGVRPVCPVLQDPRTLLPRVRPAAGQGRTGPALLRAGLRALFLRPPAAHDVCPEPRPDDAPAPPEDGQAGKGRGAEGQEPHLRAFAAAPAAGPGPATGFPNAPACWTSGPGRWTM